VTHSTLDDMLAVPPRVDNRLMSRLVLEAPRIPWPVFLHNILHWRAGEHFALIGPTGQGKTTMLLNLLPMHPYNVVFATKPRDETMDGLISTGYVKLDRWRSLDPEHYPRRVLWPDASTLDSVPRQKEVFHDAFQRIYREGGWTVALDETWYLANVLKLGADIKLYLLQARSLGISLVAASQRPAMIPVEIYDMSTHLMFWRDNDETNLKRLSGISWRSANLIRSIIANLDEHQVLYVNTRTGRMLRTRCPALVLPQYTVEGPLGR
jgi:energy-coupling factor transporter ATP-binding protein EcfA2